MTDILMELNVINEKLNAIQLRKPNNQRISDKTYY